MSEKKDELKIITVPARLSFPDLIKPKSFQGGAPKYGVQLIFPNAGVEFKNSGRDWDGYTIKQLKKLADDARKEKWGDDKAKWPKVGIKMPFTDGNSKDLESHKNATIINAKSQYAVPCVNNNREEILDMKEMYAGCWVRARLSCYAWEVRDEQNKKVILNAGVSFGLTSLQKVKDDKPFSGRGNAKDDFDAVELPDESFDESSSEDEENFDF